VVERSARLEVLARGLDRAGEGLRQALEDATPRFENRLVELGAQLACLAKTILAVSESPIDVASCPAEICASTR
jgi:hypothetical protein